ncbi:MAG: small nuclear ribonucleoprotein [Euryarchaeota archaeon]|nr:small nuclear ribonucleoprotein [Euryarchaeota archaeon]
MKKMIQSRRPFEVLSRNIGSSVTVRLKGSKNIVGTFLGYDPHWNISLAQAQELREDEKVPLGKVILRGNNVLYVAGLDLG